MISRILSEHHALCDDLYVRAENSVVAKQWDAARKSAKAFVDTMERHLGAEESCLFPSFEEAIGSSQGPTQIMRLEHAQMRRLFAGLLEAAEKSDAGAFTGVGETLLILMQQHNLKEEQMLYPMCDRAIDPSDPVETQLRALLEARP
jgi:hemerythrin-like domain-containing protein